MKSAIAVLVVAGCAQVAAAQDECVWGYFDASRLNYAGAMLNDANHSGLAGIIVAGGGTVGSPTPTLSAGYLSGIDVFYTSLLKNDGSVLSGPEQAALQAWVQGGGVLVTTADIFPLPAYDAFTSFLGVTNYTSLGNVGNATVINAHPLTAGVSTIAFNTESTYTIPGDALALANGPTNQLFAAVMDPSTGYNGGGAMFIVGDHNMFTNGSIGSADNTILAANMVEWACTIPSPGAGAVMGVMALGLVRRRR